MKVMILVILALSLAPGNFLAHAQGPPCQSYGAAFVKSWVELPLGFSESHVEKATYRGGDLIATGIVQAFTRKELLDPDRLDRILAIVQLSFSRPDYIESADAKEPRVSLVLLYFLKHESRVDEKVKKISETEQYICSQTKSHCQNE